MIIDFDENDPNKKNCLKQKLLFVPRPLDCEQKKYWDQREKRKEEKKKVKKGDRRSGPDPITLWSTFFRIFRSLFLSFIEFRDMGVSRRNSLRTSFEIRLGWLLSGRHRVNIRVCVSVPSVCLWFKGPGHRTTKQDIRGANSGHRALNAAVEWESKIERACTGNVFSSSFFCILCVPSGLTLLKFGIEIGKKRRKRREGVGWGGRKGNEQ